MTDEQTWTFYPRPVAAWGPGPWQDEPDRIQWNSEHGFVCLMLRICDYYPVGSTYPGHWCGYVGVPSDHPWMDPNFDEYSIEVHGGISGGGPCAKPDPIRHPMNRRCHATAHEDDIVWLGFDCNHSGIDLKPGDEPFPGAVYRDVSFVRQQCELLAQQAAKAR